jgi:hypothetical protein
MIMKTRLFLILAFVATAFTTTAFANTIENIFDLGGTTVKISSTEKVLVVNLGAILKEEVTISIEDIYGVRLLTETVKNKPNFVKRYNVEQLEKGDYKLIVTKKTLRTVQPFHIELGGVTISEIEKKEKFLPVLNFNSDNLDVNVLLGNLSNITVTLFDNEGRQIFAEKNYVVSKLHKRYNLEKLPRGAYIAEVMAGDETFYYTVEK